jgi:hypothetical protein
LSAVNIAFWSVCLIIPGLIGVLVGGPLIARELEYGTWRLAWSQTVPRSRWLAVKLALVTGGLIVVGAAMTAVIMWYRALLRECRILVLAMVAASRWDPGDQFPNGQRAARELLSALRAGPPWRAPDVVMRRLGGP